MSWGNRIRGNPQSVQKLLDENAQLIQAIVDYQNKGKAAECIQYQQLLHKNLMYLASLADSTQNIQSMIPPAPTSTQVPSTTPASSTMGVPGGNVPVNIQDRKILPGTSMDQGSTAIPNMTSQVISSAGSPMINTMHSAPPSMTTVQGDSSGNTPTPYGGNANMSPPAMDNSTTATGYPSNVPNQMMAQSMGAANPSMAGQQQNYMPNMHTTRLQQQGQQFMMQQGVAMGYNRPPVQMHPSQQGHPQQPINQSYMGNQGLSGQSPRGMVPYQQGTPSYDPYNPMPPHMNTGYNNPYVPQ